TVREDKVIRPDGKPGIYSVIDRDHASVQVIALNEHDEILCITLNRYPVGSPSIEIPAGGADGDDLLAAAKRELHEETGYTAATWESIGTYSAIPGLMSTACHVFLAKNLTATNTNDQQEEGIYALQFYSYQQVIQLIKESKIHDGQAIAALM